jgi:hypothetical protein
MMISGGSLKTKSVQYVRRQDMILELYLNLTDSIDIHQCDIPFE